MRGNSNVVSSTFTLNSLLVCVVFYSDPTFSFVSTRFVEKLKILLVPLDVDIIVEMIDGSRILVRNECLDCRFAINGNIYPINLKPITTK